MERRRRERAAKELDLRLYAHSGEALDVEATAFELSVDGFAARTRVRIPPEALIDFEMLLPGRGAIKGTARVAWSHEERGRYIAGAEILRLPRAQARRLRLTLDPHAADFAKTWRNAAAGLLLGMLAIVLEDIIVRQPHLRGVLFELWPSAALLLLMGACVVVFFRTWD